MIWVVSCECRPAASVILELTISEDKTQIERCRKRLAAAQQPFNILKPQLLILVIVKTELRWVLVGT
jgi:hypothetical protein